MSLFGINQLHITTTKLYAYAFTLFETEKKEEIYPRFPTEVLRNFSFYYCFMTILENPD